MQRSEVSTWCVLTLSAEQAALDNDQAHLDVLMNRREELLQSWEKSGFRFSASELKQIQETEQRLVATLTRILESTGSELRQLSNRSKSATAYRTAA